MDKIIGADHVARTLKTHVTLLGYRTGKTRDVGSETHTFVGPKIRVFNRIYSDTWDRGNHRGKLLEGWWENLA